MRLTYRPDLTTNNRKEICKKNYCRESQAPEPAVKQCSHSSSEAENVPCVDDPSKACNPYENLTSSPIKKRKFRLSCDEFPFGEFQLMHTPLHVLVTRRSTHVTYAEIPQRIHYREERAVLRFASRGGRIASRAGNSLGSKRRLGRRMITWSR